MQCRAKLTKLCWDRLLGLCSHCVRYAYVGARRTHCTFVGRRFSQGYHKSHATWDKFWEEHKVRKDIYKHACGQGAVRIWSKVVLLRLPADQWQPFLQADICCGCRCPRCPGFPIWAPGWRTCSGSPASGAPSDLAILRRNQLRPLAAALHLKGPHCAAHLAAGPQAASTRTAMNKTLTACPAMGPLSARQLRRRQQLREVISR